MMRLWIHHRRIDSPAARLRVGLGIAKTIYNNLNTSPNLYFSQSTNHYGLRHVFGFQFYRQLQIIYDRVIYFGFVRLMTSSFDQSNISCS